MRGGKRTPWPREGSRWDDARPRERFACGAPARPWTRLHRRLPTADRIAYRITNDQCRDHLTLHCLPADPVQRICVSTLRRIDCVHDCSSGSNWQSTAMRTWMESICNTDTQACRWRRRLSEGSGHRHSDALDGMLCCIDADSKSIAAETFSGVAARTMRQCGHQVREFKSHFRLRGFGTVYQLWYKSTWSGHS